MPTREMKTRFKLEGEGQFRKAMSDAASAVRVLNAEQKLAKAQFEATGDAEQYAADQSRILREQIEAQKKSVEAAEEAVRKLTENGVDKNAKQMQTWRTKLNNARTSLYQMQTRLDKVGDELGEETTGLENAEAAASGFNGEMDKVAKGVDLQNTITAIDNITGHIEAVVRTAARATKAVWGMSADAGKWADELKTAANQAGVDPETYQSWTYASRFVDTAVDDIIKSWRDIDKQLAQEGDSLYEYMGSMAQAGIGVMDATTGEMRQGKDIFWDTIDYLHNIGDEGKRSAEAMRLFGNDWRKLNPLISAGSAKYKELAEEGMSLAVVSNENVEALGNVDDAVQDFNARFDKLKYDALAELAPTFQMVAESMSEAVTAFNEFVQSEEGQAALQGLNEALQGVVGAFLGEDGGKASFAKLVDDGTVAVEKFTDAMGWLSEHGGTVTGIVTGLGVAWAGLKTAKEVLLFMQLLQATPLSKLQVLFGGNGGSAAKTVGSGTALKTAAKTARSAGGGFAAAKDLFAGMGAGAAVTAAAIAPALLAENKTREEITANLESVRQSAEDAAQAIGAEGAAAMQIVTAAADALGVSEDRMDVIGRGVLADAEAIEQALAAAAAVDAAMGSESFLSPSTRLMMEYQQSNGATGEQREALLYQVMQEAMASLTDPRTASAAKDLKLTLSDTMDSIIECQEALEDNPAQAEGGMYDLIRQLADDQTVLDNLSAGTRDMLGKWLDTESGFGVGSAGIFGDSQALLDQIYGDMESAFERAKEGGGNIPAGYAAGIDEGAEDAASASADMAQGTIDAAEATLGGEGASPVFEGIGGNVPVGMANGIYERGEEAFAAARWMAQGVDNIVRKTLDIRSPSHVLEEDGVYTGKGYAKGIIKAQKDVDRAVDAMTASTRRPVDMEYDGVVMVGESATADRRRGRRAANPKGDGIVYVTIEVDGQELGEVMAPIINDKIGAQIQATRR